MGTDTGCSVPREMMPESATEVIWLHPFDLDFNEVLSRLKTKDHEKLLMLGE